MESITGSGLRTQGCKAVGNTGEESGVQEGTISVFDLIYGALASASCGGGAVGSLALAPLHHGPSQRSPSRSHRDRTVRDRHGDRRR
jgi:hypothetical protein